MACGRMAGGGMVQVGYAEQSRDGGDSADKKMICAMKLRDCECGG